MSGHLSIYDVWGTDMKALVLAGYLVQKCLDEGWKITNLQLQKILYFIELRSIQLTGDRLITNASFEAWRFGPVIPEVYFAYCLNAGLDIDQTEEYSGLPKNEQPPVFVDSVLEHFIKSSPWSLVQLAHRPEGAWYKNYKEGMRRLIPVSDITAEAKTCTYSLEG